MAMSSFVNNLYKTFTMRGSPVFIVPLLNFQFSKSLCQAKITPTNIKKFKKSSQEWLTRHLNDPYVKLAHLQNYRARSAFKLLEINDQFNILKPGLVVLDCGAAPGAWTQVVVHKINSLNSDNCGNQIGSVIAVDILNFLPVKGSVSLTGDFTNPKTIESILKHLNGKKVDLVLSDMAPNASGNKQMDHDIIMELANSALNFAILNSQKGSSFLCKIWEGYRTKAFRKDLQKYFQVIKIVKPPSSRSDSAEVFILAQNML